MTTSPSPQAPMPDPVDLSIVIVSYHCREKVLACLESLVDPLSTRRTEVIVVDNGSTDGTVEMLQAKRPGVTLVPMGTNTGFARASNVGIARACGRHVLILNPDTIVQRGAFEVLSDWLDTHPGAGAVAPRLLNRDGTDQRTARSFPTPSAAIFGRRSPLTRWFPMNRWSRRYLAARANAGRMPFRVDWVSGAAMMVPASVIAEIGSFDESFFLFWEDADWCRRMADAGLEVWCVPQARIFHDEGGTRDHGWSRQTVTYFHRGAYLYWCKHHAPRRWSPARWGAAGVLGLRALMVMAREQLRRAAHYRPAPAAASHVDPEIRSVTL
jgi:N-acetylglucosaminyl-diphospho-decaprenol L-rhamnosyltransferase